MLRMTRRLICLSTLLATTAGAAELIGSTVPPYPDGLIEQSGACIAQSRGPEHECDYSVGVLGSEEGKPRVIVGTRMTGRDDQQKARWIVTDTLPYPDLPEGYLLAIASCQVDGKDDQTIIAVVLNAEEEWLETLSVGAPVRYEQREVRGAADLRRSVPERSRGALNVSWRRGHEVDSSQSRRTVSSLPRVRSRRRGCRRIPSAVHQWSQWL